MGDRDCFLMSTDGALGWGWEQRPHLSKQMTEVPLRTLSREEVSVGDLHGVNSAGLLNPLRHATPIVFMSRGSGEQKE